jgi:hypothetical protein
MMRAMLAKAWGGITPGDLRHATTSEICAMTEVLEDYAAQLERQARM